MNRKIRCTCPECGNSFTAATKPTVTRARLEARKNNGKLEYSLSIPDGTMPEDASREFAMTERVTIVVLGCASCGLAAAMALQGVAEAFLLRIPPQLQDNIYIAGGAIGITLGLRMYWAFERDAAAAVKWAIAQVQTGISEAQAIAPVIRLQDNHPEAKGLHVEMFPGLPIEVAAFNKWCVAVADGAKLGYRAWTGKGKPFTKDGEYIPFLQYLMKMNLVIDRGGNVGYTLTKRGQRVIGHYVAQLPTPLPQLGGVR